MKEFTKEELQTFVKNLEKEVRLTEGDLSNSRRRVRNLLQKWVAQDIEIKELRKEIEGLKDKLDEESVFHKSFQNFHTRMMVEKYKRIDALKDKLAAK